MLCILAGTACKEPSSDTLGQALSSTNTVFEPHFQEPIALSPQQSATIHHIVELFRNRSNVRMKKDAPVPDGSFVLGGVRFRWFSNTLYIHDSKTKRYYFVEDAILDKMTKAFFKAQGTKPPLQYPSREQWLEILSVLDKKDLR
jgi:hypothetical protein